MHQKLWWTDDLIKRDASEMYRNNDPDATLYANCVHFKLLNLIYVANKLYFDAYCELIKGIGVV